MPGSVHAALARGGLSAGRQKNKKINDHPPYLTYNERLYVLLRTALFSSDLIADNLCTQGYSLIEHFFPEELYHKLYSIAQMLDEQGLFQSAKIGLNIQAQLNGTIRTDKIHWLDDLHAHPAVVLYLKTMNQLAQTLNESLFLSLNDFETHFAVYQPGSFYKKHVDQFQANKTRKISCVYYLNKDWQESFGGSLKLYNQNDELIKEISPLGNRFICFNSELPHEVCPTQNTRYSITGWMKTRL